MAAVLAVVALLAPAGTSVASAAPSVGTVTPADFATGVNPDAAVTGEVILETVGAGVDESTLTAGVFLYKRSGGADVLPAVPATINTSGGADVIVLQPNARLESNTTYRFVVTAALKDAAGAAFTPKTSSFTTGTPTPETPLTARFSQQAQSSTNGRAITSTTLGPDNNLYATTLMGEVLRYPVNASTGALGAPTTVATFDDGPGRPDRGRPVIQSVALPAPDGENVIREILPSQSSGATVSEKIP